MNFVLRYIFVISALCFISSNAENCDGIQVILDAEGRMSIDVRGACLCMTFGTAVENGNDTARNASTGNETMSDPKLIYKDGLLQLENAKKICESLNATHSPVKNVVNSPTPGSSPTTNGTNNGTQPDIEKKNNSSDSSIPVPGPGTPVVPSLNSTNENATNPSPDSTASRVSNDTPTSSKTTSLVILFVCLIAGCLIAFASKFVYNRYKSQEYAIPENQHEMEARQNGNIAETRTDL